MGLLQIEVPGSEHVDNTVTIDGASMVPSTMQGTDALYDTQGGGGGPMQVSVGGNRVQATSLDLLMMRWKKLQCSSPK